MPYGTGAHVVKPPTSIAARFMSAMAVPPAHNFGRGAARSLGDDGRVICREFDVPPDARSGASADDDCAATTRLSFRPAVRTRLGAGRPGRLCARCPALRNGRPAADRPLRPGGNFELFRARFAAWGSWIIIAKGLTPIPFKLVTIASGASGLDISRFVLACIVARGGRYLLLAVLLQRYGSAVRAALERCLTLVVVGGIVLLVAGVMALWLIG